MESFVQSLNSLPLNHEKPGPRPNLEKIYRDIHSHNQSIKISDSFFHIEKRASKQNTRIHIDFMDNTFIDKEITQYVKHKASHDLILTYPHRDTHIIVYFCLFGIDEEVIEKYKSYCRWIVNWFMLCVKHSEKKCHNQIRLHLYLTPFKKMLPKHRGVTLSGEHANSAFTYHCKQNNKIVIFREEEWFKVLIHESFHYFQLEDFHETPFKIKQLFSIPTEILLGEAYGEFWARILTCLYNAYYLTPNKGNMHNVMEHCDRLLYIERMYSCFQAVKVLRHMGLRYENIIGVEDKDIIKRGKYKEDTNIFCYYVVTAILFHCYGNMITWCKKYNHSLLAFDDKDMDSFIQLVEQCRNNPSIIHNFSLMEEFINNQKDSFELSTMRMTLLDFL